MCAFQGFDKVAEVLIQNGSDIAAVGEFGETLLMDAAKRGKN